MNRNVKFDFLLLIIVLLLVVTGISMIYSASNFKAKERFGDSNFFLKKQLVRVFIGLFFMVVLYYVDYHDLQRLSWLLLLITFFLLLYVLANGIKINGSRRSIYLMSFVFQPSEAAKYALIIFLSWFLVQKGKRIQDFANGLLPALIIIGIMVLPILLEPDLGTATLIFAVACIILFVSGVNLYHLMGLGFSALATITIILTNFSYQKSRLFMFIDTVRGVREPPWQVLQSLICFANGGFWGVGLGNSKQKLHFLPQPFTDFIFSIVTEETGFIGAFILLLLFLAFLWRGIWIALNAPDKQGKLLAVGITSSIILYAFASVAIVTNILPITGIPMPFVSYGGSALIMNLVGVGILLNISSQIKVKTSSNYAFAPMRITSNNKFKRKVVKKRSSFAR